MGWRGYELEIPTGMLFRKMYCSKCGEKLKLQKQSQTIKKGEEGYQSHILGHTTIGMTEITKAEYVYICPECGQITTYDRQLQIRKRQKLLHTKIVDE